MIVQSYVLTAAETKEEDLKQALGELAAWLKNQEGNRSACILQENSASDRFLFLEYWRDEEARALAGPKLPKALMGALMTCLADRPQTITYRQL